MSKEVKIVEAQTFRFEIPGAGEIVIGSSPHCHCGGRVGFDFGVTWGRFGTAGGILPRREAEKLIKFLYEALKDITESEEAEYYRRSVELNNYFSNLK